MPIKYNGNVAWNINIAKEMYSLDDSDFTDTGCIGSCNVTTPVFSCPSESTPVGPTRGTDFVCGHYTLNYLFAGHPSAPASGVPAENYRTESQVEDASLVVFIADNTDMIGYAFTTVNNSSGDTIGLRHGGGGTVENVNTGSAFFKYYRNGKAVNIGYYDGHAATVLRDALKSGKSYLNRKCLVDGYTTNWGY